MGLGIAETEYGKVEGTELAGYTVFKGIPYARPPIGDLRWRAPQKPDAWEGVRPAKAFPCKSMQEYHPMQFYDKEFYSDGAYDVPCSEDSLYLNIWTPARTVDERLPVIFFLHGGAFMGGWGSEMEFDGRDYCREGVILVTVNYRLNIFGFLAHPWFCEENENHAAGNYGILDQIAALEWVFHNIRNFGGDGKNITIMGQSAGAMSVQTLLSSPLAGDMAARAIMQSGGGYGNGLNERMGTEEAFAYGEAFVELTGAGSAEELRRCPPEKLYKALGVFLEERMQNGKGLVFRPYTDGYVLKGFYDDLVESGAIRNIPCLLGSNKNDIFVEKKDADAGMESRLYRGCIDFSLKLEAAGHIPAYVYFFERELPGDEAGAFHSAELWYTFGTLDRCWRPMEEGDYALSGKMVRHWTNFARTGSPDGEGGIKWKPCTRKEAFVMNFNI